MTCKHQFIKIAEVDKAGQPVAAGARVPMIPGARAACILCGQVREVYANGDLALKNQGLEKPML